MADSETSPKAKVTYDQNKFEVDLNVAEYLPEELSIKTEGDVLIVLAKHETKAEGGHSYVSKQFEQRFSLPSGVKPDKISSKLSKDGVLTVTAPRESLSITSGVKKGAITSSGTGSVNSQSEETRADGLPHPRVSYDDDKFQISLDAKDYKPEDLDVRVEGNTIIITAKQEIQEVGGVRTRVFEQKFSLPSGVKAELVKSSLTREGVLVITAPRGNPAAAQSYTESVENKMNKVMDPTNWDREVNRKKDSLFEDGKDLRKKDSFFEDGKDLRKKDSFFDDSRMTREFDERRKEFFDDFNKDSIFDKRRDSAFDDLRRDSNSFSSALNNTRHGGGIFDNGLSTFSRERSTSNLNDQENGASRVVYEDDLYKILVNVDKYQPEELMIKTVDNSVVVEAKHEEKTSDGRSYSTQSFNQSFTLPRGVNPESVTSALSKSGILTISAPLPKALKSNDRERMIPIKHT